MLRYRPIVAAAMGLASYHSQAASLSQLMASVPLPPTDVSTALTWVKDGEIVAPQYLQFKQSLEAERAATLALAGGSLPAAPTPLSADIPDAPEVQTAIRAYDSYLQTNSGAQDPKTALNKRTRWLQAAMGGQLQDLMGKMKSCPEPCADPAAIKQNQPLMFKKQMLAESDLKQWGMLFQDWRRTRSSYVSTGDASIAAVGGGAKATTPAGKSAVAQYKAAMLKEIDLLLSLTETAVRRAYVIESGKVDAVSSPSRSKAKAS